MISHLHFNRKKRNAKKKMGEKGKTEKAWVRKKNRQTLIKNWDLEKTDRQGHYKRAAIEWIHKKRERDTHIHSEQTDINRYRRRKRYI